MIKSILLVGLGGAVGSMLRFSLQKMFNLPSFPFGTLAINVAGCFLIGILGGFLIKTYQTDLIKLLLMTGFCGGFTTFSAFTYESLQLIIENKWTMFAIYLSTSVLGGLLATFIGYKIMN